MVLNKRILLLTCPIFIVIIICLAAVGYSSFQSIPDLKNTIQKGHIQQQLTSSSRDLQFLDYSLEAGFQEIFKQIYSLRSFYFQILAGNVEAGSSATPLEVKLVDMISGDLKTTDPTTFSKINDTALLEQLQVSGWYYSPDEAQSLSQIMTNTSSNYYANIERDHQLFQTLIKGTLSPYYLNTAESVMTTNSGLQDNIYTAGITFPELGLSFFSPVPTETMIDSSQSTTASSTSTSCSQIPSSVYSFDNICASSETPSIYIIRDVNQEFQNVGGISQKFSITSQIKAIIYAQFELSSKQSSLINSLVNSHFGYLFITFNDDNFTLIGYDKQGTSQVLKKTLLLQIYGDVTSSPEITEFTTNYNAARAALQIQVDNNSASILPEQFSYRAFGMTYYCLLLPIKVSPGTVDTNGDLEILSSEVIFYLGFTVSEDDLVSEFKETNDRLKYIELVSFIVISVICLVSGCIVVRYSYMISYSYENPIKTMSQLMSQIDPDYVDQEDQYEQYQSYFTSDEIKSLFEAMVTLLKNFKYSNQKFHDDDALTLLELSRAKQFYMKLGNQNGVGICCNNIGNIHLKNARYLEAISEYQEAILMATIENDSTLEEIYKERLETEKKTQQQLPSASATVNSALVPPSQDATAILMGSPGNQNKLQLRGTTKRRTFLTNGSGNAKKQQKQNGLGQFMQNSSVKHLNKVSRDGTMNRPSHFQNDDDDEFNIDDVDIENSHTMRNNNIPQNGISNQFNEMTNMLSAQERKMKELILKLDISRTRLLNRKYQLGVALFEYSTQQKDDLFHEAIRVFDKCIALSDQESYTPTIIIRKILILTKKAFSHTRLGEYENTETAISEARDMLLRLQTISVEDNSEESAYLFLNIFCAIPVEILRSKIDLQEAILELARFNFRKAGQLFTKILEEGETYDSQIRKYAIVSLKNILEKFYLSTPGLEPKLMKFNLRTIEIIMLVDYSKDMTADQIKISHLRCKSIFDKINNKDKIGFVQFNDSVHENFPLQEKSMYNELLEKKIRSIPMSSGGCSNLFKALFVTAGLFEKQQKEEQSVTRFEDVIERKEMSKLMNLESKSNPVDSQTYNGIQSTAGMKQKSPKIKENPVKSTERLRFIFLFTEGNNPVKENEQQILREKMSRNNVNLIVINICQQNANMLYLRYLAQNLSEKSEFFQSNNDEAETYLESQREKLTSFQLISEYF